MSSYPEAIQERLKSRLACSGSCLDSVNRTVIVVFLNVSYRADRVIA